MLIAAIVGFTFAAQAQATKQVGKKEQPTRQVTKKEPAKTGQAQLKAHVCTSACKTDKHVYAHGEIGHICGAECKTMMSKNEVLKDHVCTSACKEGKHLYAHGEKWHVCGKECEKL